VAFDVVGDDPLLMLTAPIPATRRILAKSGMTLDVIDHYEVNEACPDAAASIDRNRKATAAAVEGVVQTVR
jgi:acetyl-CoA acetyltransferase